MFLPFGLLFVIGGWATRWRDMGIEEEGLRAIATVTSKKIVQSDDASYQFHYTFQRPDDVAVKSRRYVSHRLWRAREVGDTLTVAFDADRPTLSFPLGQGSTSAGLALFSSAVGMVFAVIGFAVVRSAFVGSATAHELTPAGAGARGHPTRNSSSARR